MCPSARSQDPPTLIVLDVMMPVMDGYTFLARLRSLGVEVPVIVLTASGRAKMEGAAVVMAKPLQPDRLCEAIRLCAA